MNTEFEYDYYEDYQDGVSQYEDVEFKLGQPVEARYVPAKNEIDRKNPYIEALPIFRDGDTYKAAYTRRLPGYRPEKVSAMSNTEKKIQVYQLRDIRFPMKYHADLESAFYGLLIASYRQRKPMFCMNNPFKFMANGEEQESVCVLYGDQSDATNEGINLVGYSGCGKTSAIHMLLSNYPQRIVHRMPNNRYFTQIPYIMVNCMASSNLSAVYANIGDEIDKALGYTDSIYGKEIAKAKGLGQKASKVCDLINRFAIGAIILDEVQFLSFSSNVESSYESILTVANRTKAVIVSVGTEETRKKLASSTFRVERRAGRYINANQYCSDLDYFKMMVYELFQYYWFDEPVKVTNEILTKLYEKTGGIVAQLINLYISMNTEYLSRNKKPKIDSKYIDYVHNKYYKDVDSFLQAFKEETERAKSKEEYEDNIAYLKAIESDEKSQEAEGTKIIEQQKQLEQTEHMLKNITVNIKNVSDYTDLEIENAFRKIMRHKDADKMTQKEITMEILELLKKINEPKAKTKRKRTSKAEKEAQMIKYKNFLENNNRHEYNTEPASAAS